MLHKEDALSSETLEAQQGVTEKVLQTFRGWRRARETQF